MTPIIGKVSEATWHWNRSHEYAGRGEHDSRGGRASRSRGSAFSRGQTALIPIAKLYDAAIAGRLPFATDFTLTYPQYQAYGLAAVQLAELTAKSGSASTLQIASAITTGGTGFFADQRTTAGLPTAGQFAGRQSRAAELSIVAAARSAHHHRADDEAAGSARAAGHQSAAQSYLPVALEQPRLRAVLRGLPQVVSDVPTKLRTTVNSVAAAKGIARMAAPLANAPGSGLIRVKAPTAPAPTRIAKPGSTLRSAELGWTSGTGHQQQLNDAVASFKGNGLTIPAGTTHIWDVPAGSQDELIVSGDSAFRVTFLTRGGSVLRRP